MNALSAGLLGALLVGGWAWWYGGHFSPSAAIFGFVIGALLQYYSPGARRRRAKEHEDLGGG